MMRNSVCSARAAAAATAKKDVKIKDLFREIAVRDVESSPPPRETGAGISYLSQDAPRRTSPLVAVALASSSLLLSQRFPSGPGSISSRFGSFYVCRSRGGEKNRSRTPGK